jgi:isopentenyl diphosphate isomerase/L-lactate dehydrogenase-like FMN-dependent dehydrogenase
MSYNFSENRLANVDNVVKESDVDSETPSGNSLVQYVQSMFDPTLTWKDIQWLKR